jgi:hypothetical protein
VTLSLKRAGAVCAAVVLLVFCVLAPHPAGAATPPSEDPFYAYSGSTPLADIAPGTVLKTRTLPYHLIGIPLRMTATQLLYRTTGALGQPTVNVTSIVTPLDHVDTTRAVAYESFYDSLNPMDEPSYSISGGVTLGGVIPDVELGVFGTFLAKGYSIIIPDTQGEHAAFAAGPVYGMSSLDAVRAASMSKATGLSKKTKVGLFGYSGGAIGVNWSAALAPAYAPDVNSRLVGAAEGGLLVDPAHNLHYISGSKVWAGVAVMALVGISRAYNVDFTPYLNDYGRELVAKMHHASIIAVLLEYPGLTWKQIANPAYQDPESIPAFVKFANKVNLGTAGIPTTPMYIGQGAKGEWEGTAGDRPGIGEGDGVMIAGDVRTLARLYCSHGTAVQYTQFDNLSHTLTAAFFLPGAISWLNQRLDGGTPAPENCATIAPGNSLAPIPMP